MFLLTHRQWEIVNYLLNNSDFMSIKEAAKKYKVTERTIRNDLNVIKKYLQERSYELISKPSRGVKAVLQNSIDNNVNSRDNQLSERILTKNERVNFIIIQLLTTENYITIDNLAELLFVSKNTVASDLNEVKLIFDSIGICLYSKPNKGIKLIGDETTIRNGFQYIYCKIKTEDMRSHYLKELNDIDKKYNLREAVILFEKLLQITYADNSRDEIITLLSFTIKRCLMGKHADNDCIIDSKEEEYKILKEICKNNQFISDNDISYILRIFKGAKVFIKLREDEDKFTDLESKMFAAIIIQDCEKALKVPLSEDETFVKGLAIHLKVALYRLRNGLMIDNPMALEIKYRITLIYEIVNDIIKKYQNDYNVIFPDSEIAYLATHIGAGFERVMHEVFKIRALIVCSWGIGTSSLLITRLKAYLPELELLGPLSQIDLSKKSLENIDIVISTIPLALKNIKVIIVNPLIDMKDIEDIKKLSYKLYYEKECNYLLSNVEIDYYDHMKGLVEYIGVENICIETNKLEWREAIRAASKKFVEKNYVTTAYVETAIDSVEQWGPYCIVIPGIAFVHSNPDLVINNCLGLTILKEEIVFGDNYGKTVKVIFFFGAKEEKDGVLTKLIPILERNNNIEKLLKAKCIEDIYEIT